MTSSGLIRGQPAQYGFELMEFDPFFNYRATQYIVDNGYETSNVWHIAPRSSKKHSAIFPIELCDRVINYYSFKGDLIYDPFAGSGSVGKSAIKAFINNSFSTGTRN